MSRNYKIFNPENLIGKCSHERIRAGAGAFLSVACKEAEDPSFLTELGDFTDKNIKIFGNTNFSLIDDGTDYKYKDYNLSFNDYRSILNCYITSAWKNQNGWQYYDTKLKEIVITKKDLWFHSMGNKIYTLLDRKSELTKKQSDKEYYAQLYFSKNYEKFYIKNWGLAKYKKWKLDTQAVYPELKLNKLSMKKETILFTLTILFTFVCNAQIKKLSELRNIYCEEQCDFYHKHLYYLSKLPSWPPSPLEISPEKETLIPLFKIPLVERKKLFPFSKYDSVYIVTPKYHDDKEPRNYIKSKFHDSKTLVTEEQMNKISDILFNYYEVIYNKFITTRYTITGRNGIKDTYPKIILVFVKNGKSKDYIAFPSQIFRRTSFSSKELDGLDLSTEKEKMIMEIFGVNLEEPEGAMIQRDEDGILNNAYKEN